jgi:hypothetical protein
MGMGWVCCCSGELSGEPLLSDERSEPECMDCSWRVSAVPRQGRGTNIVVGHEVEGAEQLVVLEVERAGQLELAPGGEGLVEGRLLGLLLLQAQGAQLLLLVVLVGLGGARGPPRAPAAAAAGDGTTGGSMVVLRVGGLRVQGRMGAVVET